jgi:hypothetical protein
MGTDVCFRLERQVVDPILLLLSADHLICDINLHSLF